MKFITEYWTQLVFLISVIGTFAMFILVTIEGVKC